MSIKLTRQELLQLYFKVESYISSNVNSDRNLSNTEWRAIGTEFNISPNSAFKIYNNTNWEEVLNGSDGSQNEDLELEEDKLKEKVSLLIEQRKEKVLDKHELKKQNEYLEKIATETAIMDKIISAVSAVPEIPLQNIKYPNPNKFLTRPQEAVLCLSDIHIGLAVNPNEVGNLGMYNIEIYKKRLNNLVKKIVAITEHHRHTSQLDTLHIFSLGDIVHGSNDAGQWGFLHTEINIWDQILLAINDLEEAILKLNQVFPNIKFYGVYGNHGRVAKREKEKRFVNWDYMIYQFMQKALQNQKGISFQIPRSPFLVTEILGNKFLLTHGDQVKGWNGLPFYGMVRSETRLRTILERTKSVEGLLEYIDQSDLDSKSKEDLLKDALLYSKTFDYMVMGHFHSMAELETNSGGRIILNSSFAGGDDYSINTLMSANSAAQKFFGVHEEGKSWTYDIQLDRE